MRETFVSKLLLVLMGLFLIIPVNSRAEVLVELFTSQGCSSCVLADDYLADLDSQEDIIALAFHVNYWDYLGWKDSFARESYTERQAGYQQRNQSKQLYTPQFVIGGALSFAGDNLDAVNRAIDFVKSDFEIDYKFNGSALSIMPIDEVQNLEVYLAYVIPEAKVKITAGENEGKTLMDHNVVSQFVKLGNWTGIGSFEAKIAEFPEQEMVLIIQEGEFGAVKYATRLS